MFWAWDKVQWRLFGGLSLSVILFHVALWTFDAPYLHGSKGDNLLTFVPLIKAHTDAFLTLEPLRALWSIGAGWDPFESGQIGLFYPFYHLANLIARLLGMPLAILDISFVLHQCVLVAMIVAWLEGAAFKKASVALVLVFAPASLLLGMNWHPYGISHIWFIGLVLFLEKRDHFQQRGPDFSSSVILLVLNFLFFASAHLQMFVWGELFVFGWIALFSKTMHAKVKVVRSLFLVNLPLVPPLVYFKWLSTQASANMMNLRNTGASLTHFSQDIAVALQGTFLGNFVHHSDFRLWSENIDAAGIGLFFQPLWGLVLILGLLRKRWLVLCFFVVLMMLLGVRSFPWLDVLAVGPLKGFRWTWKLTLFVSPLCCLAVLKLAEDNYKWLSPLMLVVGLCSMLMGFQGRHTNFSAIDQSLVSSGLEEIVKQTSSCLSVLQVPQNARLVQVGDHDIAQTKSMSVLGLMGHTPLLVQRQTAHMYEPLERAQAAEGHLKLSVPWRVHIGTQEYLSKRERIEKAFRFMGVTHLFSSDARTVPVANMEPCLDKTGAPLFIWPLPQARSTAYPQPMAYDVVDNVEVRHNGLLWVASNSERYPKINVTREIAWEKQPTGWLGYPQPLHPAWPLATFILLISVFGVFWRFGK